MLMSQTFFKCYSVRVMAYRIVNYFPNNFLCSCKFSQFIMKFCTFLLYILNHINYSVKDKRFSFKPLLKFKKELIWNSVNIPRQDFALQIKTGEILQLSDFSPLVLPIRLILDTPNQLIRQIYLDKIICFDLM